VAQPKGALAERLSLVEAVDHLLNRGVVLAGDATVSLAGVDLIYVGLNLVVASVERLRQSPDVGAAGGLTGPRGEPLAGGPAPGAAAAALAPPARGGRRAAVPPIATGGPAASAAATPVATGGPEASAPPSPALGLAGLPDRLNVEPGERPEQGLARLVLTLVELLRQILERQAVRRLEGGGLAEEEIERMGQALMELEAKMVELRTVFGLSDEDLNVDLGPLGDLL
jgi:hypothetical protein